MSINPDISFCSINSRRCEELARNLSGWTVSMLSTSPRAFSGDIVASSFGGLTVSQLITNGDTVALLAPESGRTGIVLVGEVPQGTSLSGYTSDCALLWHGQGGNTLMVRGTGTLTLHLLTWPSATSPIPSAYYLRTNRDSAPETVGLGHARVAHNDAALRTIIDRVLACSGDDHNEWSTQMTAGIGNSIAGALVNALEHSSVDELHPNVSHRKVRVYIDAHNFLKATRHWLSPSTADIAKTAGVKERTLQVAIKDVAGVTPKQLSRLFQLQRIRDYIESAGDEVESLTLIAGKAGFSSPSHFSSSFKRLFGHSPSDIAGIQK